MRSAIHSLSFFTLRKPSNLVLVLETVGSCSCSPSVLRNSGSISRTFSSLKALMPIRCFGSTLLSLHRYSVAFGLIVRSLSSMGGSSASSTRSILFRRMRSANATCSAASFSTPSGFSSSMRERMYFESHTVMIPSSVNIAWMSSSTKNVWATGAGSASPVVSMMTASNWLILLYRFFSATTRSPRTVQQMHPFITSITSSSAFSDRIRSSTPTSPNSFSMMAKRRPWSGSSRMWLSSVVLPLPRKPVKIVTGIFRAIARSGAEADVWAARARVAGEDGGDTLETQSVR